VGTWAKELLFDSVCYPENQAVSSGYRKALGFRQLDRNSTGPSLFSAVLAKMGHTGP
jgi:hypothetical protein